MLPTAFKTIIGALPVGLYTILSVNGIDTDSIISYIAPAASFGSAGFYFSQWRAERKSHKKTWEKVEETRQQRDQARTRCADCPGNELRRNHTTTHLT